jgi:ABC-2 type transport system ATP-binding protein
MRKRLGIAQAILEKPQVLILDEPTDAIDQAGWKGVYEYLIQLKEDGVTILFSSNNLDEISLLCDQAYVLENKHLRPAIL